ncbi:MAG: hypothetical protein J6I97_05125 [Agathobacter sp.]|nr:hypothetical protein [Agathobacter sp.]
MLKALKSYWAFTSGIYKVLMFLVLPILLVVINWSVLQADVGSGLEIFLVLFYIDTFLDFFFMGGFYCKKNGSFAFLQSSNRFSKFAREIVIVDVVRRVLLYQIPYIVTLIWTIRNTEQVEWWKTMAYLPWMLAWGAQLVTLVSRHYTTWNYVYLCGAVGFLIIGIAMAVTLFLEINNWVFSAVLIIGVLSAGWGTCLYTDKKVRESYYDK